MRSLALRCVVLAALPLLVYTSPAPASIVPVSQDRFTEAAIEVAIAEDSDSDFTDDFANAFDPFDSDIAATASIFSATGSSSAMQDSLILSNAITASGSAATSASGATLASGNALSNFDVTLDIDVAELYSLTGMIDAASGGAATDASITLHSTLLGSMESISVSGTGDDTFAPGLTVFLPIGEYTITALAETVFEEATTNVSASASFNFELKVVPEPGCGVLLLFLAAPLLRRRI